MTVLLPPLNPALFHLDTDHLWLMHCSDGPVPRSVVHAERAYLHKELWPWEMEWVEDNLGVPEALRLECAKIVNGVAQRMTIRTCGETGHDTSSSSTTAAPMPWTPWTQ